MPEASPDCPSAWTALSAAASLLAGTFAGPCLQVWYCWRQETGAAGEEAGWLGGDDAWLAQAASSTVAATRTDVRKIMNELLVTVPSR
jgi:hypothetical protein